MDPRKPKAPSTTVVKRAKRADDESTYHPKRDPANKRKKAPGEPLTEVPANIMLARFEATSTHTTKAGVVAPLKHSLLLDHSIVAENNYDPESFKENLNSGLLKSETYSPIVRITKFNALGSPVEAETSTAKVRRTLRCGPLSFMSSDENLASTEEIEIHTALKAEEEFFKSPQYAAAKEVLDKIKNNSVWVTERLLLETHQEHVANNFQRSSTQNAQLAKTSAQAKDASATNYAQATQLFSGAMKWEWLHLVAHMILGAQAQDAGNLVGATIHTNTAMMAIEAEIKYLAKQYPLGFQLDVSAELIPNTHLGTKIKYEISTPRFKLPLDFLAQNPNPTHIAFRQQMHTLVRSMVTASKMTTANISAVALPFYEKKPAAAQTAPPTMDQEVKKTPTKS